MKFGEIFAPRSFSVTRFGEISPLWLGLEILWQLFNFYLVFGKILNLLLQMFSIGHGKLSFL